MTRVAVWSLAAVPAAAAWRTLDAALAISREAGISVQTKASQLWHVGAGLPLDALKKGSIVEWACTYRLDKAEVPPLIPKELTEAAYTARIEGIFGPYLPS